MLALAALLRQVYKMAEHQVPEAAAATDIAIPEPPAALNGHGHQAAELFAEDLARGEVPGIRRIRKQMHVGQPRAQQVREYLARLAGSNGHRTGGDRDAPQA